MIFPTLVFKRRCNRVCAHVEQRTMDLSVITQVHKQSATQSHHNVMITVPVLGLCR